METLLPIVAIALIFWLLIIRPAQRRQKQIAQVQSSVAPGETVMLTSGIYGTVTETDDDTLLVEVSPGVNLKVARGAVGSVIRADEGDETEPESDSETDGVDGADETAETGADTTIDDDNNEER